MFSMSWVTRIFVCAVLLCMSTVHQADGGNKTIPIIPEQADHNCVCYDVNGKAVNPAQLQHTDGSPRFKKRGSHGRKYGYNPCRSFAIGPAGTSDCYADVAICMWTTEGAKIYQNIGRQSTARCGYDKDYRTLRLEYRNDDYAPNWKAHVIMKCDPSISKEKATFEVLKNVNTTRRFLLTQNCLCGGQCPLDDSDPTNAHNNPSWQGPLEGGLIGAISVVFILPLLYYRKEIWQCLTKRDPDNDEGRHLNAGGDQIADYSGNQPNNCNTMASIKDDNTRSKRDNSASLC